MTLDSLLLRFLLGIFRLFEDLLKLFNSLLRFLLKLRIDFQLSVDKAKQSLHAFSDVVNLLVLIFHHALHQLLLDDAVLKWVHPLLN